VYKPPPPKKATSSASSARKQSSSNSSSDFEVPEEVPVTKSLSSSSDFEQEPKQDTPSKTKDSSSDSEEKKAIAPQNISEGSFDTSFGEDSSFSDDDPNPPRLDEKSDDAFAPDDFMDNKPSPKETKTEKTTFGGAFSQMAQKMVQNEENDDFDDFPNEFSDDVF